MSDNKHKMHVKTWSKPRLKNYRKQSNKVMKKKILVHGLLIKIDV